jgi:hypothetical protein
MTIVHVKPPLSDIDIYLDWRLNYVMTAPFAFFTAPFIRFRITSTGNRLRQGDETTKTFPCFTVCPLPGRGPFLTSPLWLNLTPRGEVVHQGWNYPLELKFSVCPSIFLKWRECSPLGVNEGVNIPPRGQSSPLGASGVKLRMALRVATFVLVQHTQMEIHNSAKLWLIFCTVSV